MNRFQKIALISVLSLAVTAIDARAATIDFNGAFTNGANFVIIGGFRFTITGGNQNGFLQINSEQGIVESDQTKLYAANHTEITMTREGDRAFNLVSLDLGGGIIADSGSWASNVRISGGVKTTDVAPGAKYQPVLLDFFDVKSVTFVPFMNARIESGENDYEFTLDNIVWNEVAAVPDVGSTMPLLGLGIVCLGVMRFGYRS